MTSSRPKALSETEPPHNSKFAARRAWPGPLRIAESVDGPMEDRHKMGPLTEHNSMRPQVRILQPAAGGHINSGNHPGIRQQPSF